MTVQELGRPIPCPSPLGGVGPLGSRRHSSRVRGWRPLDLGERSEARTPHPAFVAPLEGCPSPPRGEGCEFTSEGGDFS